MSNPKPVVIEQTAKTWKAMQAIGVVIGAIGVISTFAAVSAIVSSEIVWPSYVAVCMCAIGVVTYLIGSTAAWWYHG